MTSGVRDKRIRVTVVGDGDTGKTCLLIVYKDKKFEEYYIPTVFDSYSMHIPIKGEDYTVILSDTAGQEEYDRLRPLAYKDTDVFIMCFAVNNIASFNNIKSKWNPEIRHYRPHSKIILVGTKIDLRVETKRHVTSVEGEHMKRLIQADGYLECSAKYLWNVDKVFETAMLSTFEPSSRVKKRNSLCALL